MTITNPCSICLHSVNKNHRAILCDICNLWVHIGCSYISPNRYKAYQQENEIESDKNNPFYCNRCIKDLLAFGNETDNSFHLTNTLGINSESNLHDLNITLDQTEKRKVKQISELILENADPEGNVNFCRYYSAEKFQKTNFNKNDNFSIFHLNIASLQYHIDDLKILLECLKHTFDVVAISETKIKKDCPPTINIKIDGYDFEDSPTEAGKGGTLLYISKKHDYKTRADLEINESKKVESTFIEIINPNGKNKIVGCIYKHHTISQKEFNELLQPLIQRLTKETKPCYITDDFIMTLLSMNKD